MTWNVWAYFNILLRNWRALAKGVLAGGLVSLLVALLLPATYTTEVQFAPAETSRLPSIGGLSPSLLSGLGGLASSQQSSPYFYMTLAQSTEILREVIMTPYPLESGPGRTLLDIDNVTGKTFDDRLNTEIRRLQKRVTVSVDRDAGVITLSVEARTPALSAAMATTFLEAINRFNLHSRNSSAHAKRVFLDARVSDVGAQLGAAEDSLKAFLIVNRTYDNSPSLAFEYARLKRRVDIYQDLYLTVRRENELAAIDEVSDVPVITVVQPVIQPTEKSKPRRRLLVLAGVGLGGLTAYGWLLLRIYFQTLAPEERTDIAALGDSWRLLLRELATLVHRA